MTKAVLRDVETLLDKAVDHEARALAAPNAGEAAKLRRLANLSFRAAMKADGTPMAPGVEII